MPGIYILIPAYNEEKYIARVILEASKYGKVIVCDDGSTDYTGDIAKKMGAEVIKHGFNKGYGASLKSLFIKVLEYMPDIVVTIDADLQHDPSYIPVLIDFMKANDADIVIGARSEKDETPIYRRLGVKIFSKLLSKEFSDVQSGYRVYKGSIIQNLIPKESGMEASIEILENALEHGYKIIEYPIMIRYKGLQTSTLNPLRHGYNIFTKILHLKVLERPITYLGIPGFLMFLTGLLSGIWVILRYMEVRQVAIGTAVITAILIISGIIFMLVAIQLYVLKEYIIRLSR